MVLKVQLSMGLEEVAVINLMRGVFVNNTRYTGRMEVNARRI